MKIRVGFVTNSSSSSFICLKIKSNFKDEILKQNNLPLDEDELYEAWQENNYDGFDLKGNLKGVMTEGYLYHIAKDLCTGDLENKTLKQLKAEMVDEFNQSYDNIKISENDIEFEYGEIEC